MTLIETVAEGPQKNQAVERENVNNAECLS